MANKIVTEVKQAWKAVVGFFAPSLVIIGSSVQSASDGGTHITQAEWVTALVAAFVTSGAVYAVKNGKSPDPTTSTPEV